MAQNQSFTSLRSGARYVFEPPYIHKYGGLSGVFCGTAIAENGEDLTQIAENLAASPDYYTFE